MANVETQAIVQDSCERWYLCYEYIERWSPGFFERMKRDAAMRVEMRKAVCEVNERIV